jgi:outer membrane protein assembly factor BamB
MQQEAGLWVIIIQGHTSIRRFMGTLAMLRMNWFVLGLVTVALLFGNARAQEKGIADFPKLSASTDWPWWRGPLRDGIAAEGSFPSKFKEADAKWKASVPGRGHSSPVVVGDRVFLTTAEMKGQKQFALAYDRKTGEPLWKEQLNQGGFPAENHAKNTEATPTLASDGERLFATFFHHEAIALIALNLDGKKLWEKNAGHFNPQRYKYGYAPSPLIYRDRVIIAAEYDGNSFIAAFKREDGNEIWRIKRQNNITFSSPVVAHVGGKDQLLISGAGQVASYDPASGQPLWSVPGTTAATCGTMVWDGDIVFASGGYPDSQTIAVDAKAGKMLWSNNQKCYEQSMIVVDGHLYALTGAGVLFCWEATTGKEMWKQRLKGPVSASPIYAGGNIYWANELGSLYVFKANPKKYTQVAENKIGTDSFPSPAAAGGQIFLRVANGSGENRKETLYCFE